MGGGSGKAASEPGGSFESCFGSGAILRVRRDKYPPERSAVVRSNEGVLVLFILRCSLELTRDGKNVYPRRRMYYQTL